MNKLTKGAIAAAAGVVLLLGGGGTLAYWNASTSVGAGTIQSGNLAVAPVTPSNAVWKSGTTTINLANFRAVPGDTLTFTQDISITASGNNLLFTVGIAGGAFTGDQELIDELTSSAAISIAGANLTPLGGGKYSVATAGTSTATVTVTVTWPFGATVDNDAKSKSVTLSNSVVTLTQVAS